MLKRSHSIASQSSRRPVKRTRTTRTKRAQPRASVANIRPRLEVKARQTDSAGDVVLPVNAAEPFFFGLISDGDSENERNGKLIKHLDYDFSFTMGTAASQPIGAVRVILGTVSGRYAADLANLAINAMDNFDTGLTSPFNILRAYDPETTKSFKIHHDSVYNIASGTTNDLVSGDSAPTFKVFSLPTIYAKFDQEYNGSSGEDAGNIRHFGLIINSHVAPVNILWNVQNRFVDI